PQLSRTVTLTGDEHPRIEHDLTPGSWLVEVREQNLDLRVVVETTDARSELVDHVPRHGVHAQVVRVTAPARLAVELRSADHRKKVGQGIVSIARWNTRSEAPPGALERGFEAFGLAGAQMALNTPEANTRAADKLHEAITHFEDAGDD